MPKYHYPQAQVVELITGFLTKIKPADAVWNIPVMADYVYQNGVLPASVAPLLSRNDVMLFDSAMALLINCGCAGSRGDIMAAAKALDGIGLVQAVGAGLAKMAENAIHAVNRFYVVSQTKD